MVFRRVVREEIPDEDGFTAGDEGQQVRGEGHTRDAGGVPNENLTMDEILMD